MVVWSEGGLVRVRAGGGGQVDWMDVWAGRRTQAAAWRGGAGLGKRHGLVMYTVIRPVKEAVMEFDR